MPRHSVESSDADEAGQGRDLPEGLQGRRLPGDRQPAPAAQGLLRAVGRARARRRVRRPRVGDQGAPRAQGLRPDVRRRRPPPVRRAAVLGARPLQPGGDRKTIAYLERLDHCGVAFKSYTEPFLDTDSELIAHIVLGMTSYYAQQGALRISARTKAGLERARRNGKVLGRPDGFERWTSVLAGMREREFSQGRMSRETGLSYNTVKKYLRRLRGGRLARA